MPPEQARGLPVDRRADNWAFGVLLFEMLSGRRPFAGATLTDVLAAVVTAEPDWRLLPAATPPSLVRLVRRCLQKDARQRLRDIGDARIEIERSSAGPTATAALRSPCRRHRGPRPRWREVVMSLLGAAAAGLAVWLVTRPAPVEPGRPAIQHRARRRARGSKTCWMRAARRWRSRATAGSWRSSRAVPAAESRSMCRRMDSVDAEPVPAPKAATCRSSRPTARWLGFASDGKLCACRSPAVSRS